MFYYMYIIFLNIQCGVVAPIHRVGDGAHAAGIADHGGVGGGITQGFHCCDAAALAQSADHAVAGHTSKKAPLKKI